MIKISSVFLEVSQKLDLYIVKIMKRVLGMGKFHVTDNEYRLDRLMEEQDEILTELKSDLLGEKAYLINQYELSIRYIIKLEQKIKESNKINI